MLAYPGNYCLPTMATVTTHQLQLFQTRFPGQAARTYCYDEQNVHQVHHAYHGGTWQGQWQHHVQYAIGYHDKRDDSDTDSEVALPCNADKPCQTDGELRVEEGICVAIHAPFDSKVVRQNQIDEGPKPQNIQTPIAAIWFSEKKVETFNLLNLHPATWTRELQTENQSNLPDEQRREWVEGR